MRFDVDGFRRCFCHVERGTVTALNGDGCYGWHLMGGEVRVLTTEMLNDIGGNVGDGLRASFSWDLRRGQ